MNNIITSLPIMLYISNLLKENKKEIEKYLLGPCKHIKVINVMELVMTFCLVHIAGYRCIYQYGKSYQNIVPFGFSIFGAGKIRNIFGMISSSMLSWKLLLLQRVIVKKNCAELLNDRKQITQKGENNPLQTLDIDGISFVSFSDKREGSMLGYHRRYKGKPTLQGSASYIGKIFVDFKLFAGNVNVCIYFQKAIKRAMSMGYKFSVVRADTIYGV